MALLRTLQRSLIPDDEGWIEFLTITVRLKPQDMAYCFVRCMASRGEAREFMEKAGS